MEFVENIQIIPSTTMYSLEAARTSGLLKQKGMTIDDNDLLIAGMMLSFGINKILTKNKKHFSKIKGIEVISY